MQKKKDYKNAEKIGFRIEKGLKHDLALCIQNGKKTTIPRHNEIKREIVDSIAEFILDKNIEKEKLLKLLK